MVQAAKMTCFREGVPVRPRYSVSQDEEEGKCNHPPGGGVEWVLRRQMQGPL